MAGIRIRLTTKPGESLTTNGNLPIFCENTTMLFTVSPEVCGDCTTSTSFITAAGLKKFIPTTLFGLFLTSARADMLKEEVFDAIIDSCGQ
jgi:hypothetical protein